MGEDLAIIVVFGQRLPHSHLFLVRFALILVQQHVVVIPVPRFQFGVHRRLTKAHEFLRQRFRGCLFLVYHVVDHLERQDLAVNRLLFRENSVLFDLVHFHVSTFTTIRGLSPSLGAPHHLLLVQFAILVVNIQLVCPGKRWIINLGF